MKVNNELDCYFIAQLKTQSLEEEAKTLKKEMQDLEQRHSQKQVCKPSSSLFPSVPLAKLEFMNSSL